MRAYAERFGEDVELWGMTGLLHDLDYERYPDLVSGHPRMAIAELERLDYPPELANVPEAATESFAGVANPFSLGRLEPGECVADLGCGAGTDTLVAAQMVGSEGSVTGIDMTPEMLAKARRRVERVRANINDAVFVDAVIEAFDAISPPASKRA